MLRALGLVPALLALIAWGSSIAFATGSPPCGPRHERTLASNHVARVYYDYRRANVYACTSSHTYLLGGAGNELREQVHPVALNGTVTAYGLTRSGVDTIVASVIVLQLRDGKQLRRLSATTRPLGAESFQAVDSVVVRSDGAVAWIASAHSIGSRGPADVEVVKADARGEERLDSGSEIRLRSLKLEGSHLTWLHGAHTRSATLH